MKKKQLSYLFENSKFPLRFFIFFSVLVRFLYWDDWVEDVDVKRKKKLNSWIS